ncbi:CHAT domain-containing tetratricopeptide repeat protein [Pyxidicoccus caerfyrddinensis]|uniref:CHAT domain-containing tetratricopeptide repeat protein n=1 Tax=Pyxidicoccus caerfyrddinensis TaxID=2709663 RepID=UPI0013DCE943|nr:CHAT domain-containing tetratricopeptide repeat protein [Pyxidicoccus caerfyrddinensis]
MQQVLRWTTVAVLCWAAGSVAGDEQVDARLQQARTAYAEAAKLRDAGRYAEALAQGEQALALREAVLGSTHPDVASCQDLLGTLHELRADYARAEPLLQRARELREMTLGENHPAFAASLNNLGNLFTDQGLYGRAEPLYQRALAIREVALGKNHPDVADSLNSLARLYARQGLYGRAEPLYRRALTLRKAVLGKDHPDLARTLNNLANLYREQGQCGLAEPLYERALAIRESALGTHHPLVATSLNNLASLCREMGQYGRAALLYERALAIDEAVLGEKHPDVARTLDNLAALYADQGLSARTGPLCKRALAIREETLGNNHPDVAYSLNSLAGFYMTQGKYGLAEPLYLRTLSIREAALGHNHPLVAEALNNLGQLRLAQQRLADALPLFSRAFAISEKRLRQEALDFSESRLDSFLKFLRADEERLYALLRAHPDDVNVQRLALSAVLLLKGRSIEEAADTSHTVYRSLGAEDRETFKRLRDLRTQLASLALPEVGALNSANHQQRLKDLAEQGDDLEASLARHSAPLRALAALPAPADIVDRVAQALPEDGALVEFIAYVDRPLVPQPVVSKPHLRYLALVLLPDSIIRTVDLGPAEPIDLAASRLRDAMANREAAFHAHSKLLYQLVFQPLLPLLGNVHHLLLSPDGQLALVPFSALHDGYQFLVDDFDFTYVNSGKELLPRSQRPVPASSVVVLADPDFSAPLQSPTSSAEEAPARAERTTSLARFFSTRREELARRDWSLIPLPGTRQEAEAIQRLLPQAQLFLGPSATKERLLQMPTPGILHLATHGFFLEDAPAPTNTRAVGSVGLLSEDPHAPRPPDPLLRSGLLFAGANAPTPSTSSASQPPPERALATALELAGLNLWGTQLVVLSACDTGRGDVKLGQGVYGLRRALVVAGAETVVMSLWKVSDDVTHQLMEAYYRKLLAGQGRATALREAMRELRRTQPHPHYWAPFIAMGKETPLRMLESKAQE